MDLFVVLLSVLAILYALALIRYVNKSREHTNRPKKYYRGYGYDYNNNDDDDDDDDDPSFQTPDYSGRHDVNKTPKRSALKKKRSPSTERERRLRRVNFDDQPPDVYN